MTKIFEKRLITVLFFYSLWEITLYEALFREKAAMLSIFMQNMIVVV
jgi:hypothetical protein